MNRTKLILLACPALLASMVLVASPAHATDAVAQPTNRVESAPAKPIFEVVFEQQSSEDPMANAAIDASNCGCGETPMLEFTDQESNAAINRYGCDCSGCLNALRQLQGKLPLL